MDAPTIIAVLAATVAALKMLTDLTLRYLALERVRLRNEAVAAPVAAAVEAALNPPGAGGTGT